MRYKSTPLSARVPRAMPTPPRKGPASRHVVANIIGTAILVLLLPAVIYPALVAQARTPALRVDGTAQVGTAVTVVGEGFPSHEKIVLRLDGQSSGSAAVRTTNDGVFSQRLMFPSDTPPGSHIVSAGVQRRRSWSQLAALTLMVVQAPLTSSSVPAPTPAQATPPAAATSTPVATATATATASARPTPTLAPVVTPAPPVVTPVPSTPHPTPIPPPSGGGWQNVLTDNFDSGGVPSHWSLYDGPYGSGPHNCATPSHVSVSGGSMRMLMRYELSGKCGAGWYTGGMMFASQYGGNDQRLTLRFRIVNGGVIGHHVIPMRWPTQASWPAAGEEDYCEGDALSGCQTFLHYSSSNQQVHHAYSFDLSQWHTVRFERRDFVVRAYIDNMSTPVWTYSGASGTLPDTFKRAVLQQECQSSCPSGTTGTEEIQIDWLTIDDPA